MSKPDRAAPRVPAGPKSLAAAAGRISLAGSDADLGNDIGDVLQCLDNAVVATDAVISFGERLEDVDEQWILPKIRSNASLLTRLAYVADSQTRSAMETLCGIQDQLREREADAANAVGLAFEEWLTCKVDQLNASGLDANASVPLDAAESAAFNTLAAAPAASANDIVLKVFALAALECDDGLAHPGRTGAFDLAPPPGLGYVSTIWRGLLADLPRASSVVRDALAIPTSASPVRRAA